MESARWYLTGDGPPPVTGSDSVLRWRCQGAADACSACRSAMINRCCSAGGTDPGLDNDRRIAAAKASRAVPAATCAVVIGSSALA
jgi:hypothetical protein